MKRAWPAVRWTLDKLLRLAAAATALVAIPVALIGGPMIDRAATTQSLIAALSIMVFGFMIALSLLVASVAFWPDKSEKLKTPALIVLTIIYVSGTGGLGLAGAGFIGIAYAKSHSIQFPTRVDTARIHQASQATKWKLRSKL
jgi:MFS family permease